MTDELKIIESIAKKQPRYRELCKKKYLEIFREAFLEGFVIGYLQGLATTRRYTIVAVLQRRFGTKACKSSEQRLQRINDVAELKELCLLSISCSGIAVFRKAIKKKAP